MKKVLMTALMLSAASPAMAQHWHGGGGGWHHGGGGFGYRGGGGFGPGAAIAGGLLGLGIAGAMAGSYYAQPSYAPRQYYYAPQCFWVYDQWGRAYQQCQ